MAETASPARTPFGGITRIRFKGYVSDVSAKRLPRTFFLDQNKAHPRQVNCLICPPITRNTAAVYDSKIVKQGDHYDPRTTFSVRV
jgi:hypothetical protein